MAVFMMPATLGMTTLGMMTLGMTAQIRIALVFSGLLLAGTAHALDLLDAYRIAVGSDATYLAARATADAARETLPQARAGLLPQISASAGRSRNNTDQTTQGAIPGQNISRQFDYAARTTTLNVRQPLVRLVNIANYFSAQAQVAAAEANLEQDAQAMALRLAGAYFDALVMRDKFESFTIQKETYLAQLAAAERSLTAGFGTRTDIDDAKTRVDITAAKEIEAQHNLRVAERTLGGLLNQPVRSASLAGIDTGRLQLTMPHPDGLADWISRAEEKNPELRALRSSIEAAEQEVNKGRATHLPTLDLVASMSNNDSDSNTTIGSKYVTSSIGVQLNIPIYAGGQIDSTVRQARANLEKTRQQYEAGRRQIEIEVVKQFGAIEQGIARIRALEQAHRSAEQSVLSSRKAVQAGVRSSIDVLNALQQLSAAWQELVQARYTYLFDRLKLKSAAGMLGEWDIAEINGWLTH